MVFVGRDEDHVQLRIVGLIRPVLAAPQTGAELRGLAGPRLVREVDIRSASLRVDALEDVLRDVRLPS